jgi:Protein of unknown function (DUF4241)
MKTPLIPDYLEQAFQTGFTVTLPDNEKYDFEMVEVGLLKVPEGKIIACDPLTAAEDQPFSETFPIGQFPVQLAVARIDDDRRVGFARIKFADSEPQRWMIATCEGEDADELEPDEIFGYGVDAGTGAFMDVTGYKALVGFLDDKEENYNVLVDKLLENNKTIGDFLLWEHGDTNVAIFSSGWGDGYYPTFIGYDEHGKICRLVTDFCVLDYEAEE